MKRIDSVGVLLIRYSRPFLKWTSEELSQRNQRLKKLMTMHKILPSRDDIDRLYVSRKDGGIGLRSIDDCVDVKILGLKVYSLVWLSFMTYQPL